MSSSNAPPQTHPSPRRALFEFAGFVALAFASKAIADPVLDRLSGPVTLIGSLCVIALYMRWRGYRAADLGLRRLRDARSWWLLVPQTLLAIVAILGTGIVMTLLGELSGLSFMSLDDTGVADRFGDLAGNPRQYALWLSLSWISAGFAEELFFRGMLISRIEIAMQGRRFARSLAVLLPALVFGIAHFSYQGFRGLVVTGAIGLALGGLFLLYRKNLWPLMLAHALVDSLVFTALYLDWDV